jgi:hypothetical protein
MERVVEGARLENDSGDAHRATSKHFVAIDSTIYVPPMFLDVML